MNVKLKGVAVQVGFRSKMYATEVEGDEHKEIKDKLSVKKSKGIK